MPRVTFFNKDRPVSPRRLRYQDTNPFPRIGQYWAHTNPLSLHRVTHVGDKPSYSDVAFESWTPEWHEEGRSFIMPMNRDWFHLSHQYSLDESVDWDKPLIGKIAQGDVYRDPLEGSLIFVGDVEGELVFLADHQIPDLYRFELFQKGPTPAGLTLWDHIEGSGVKDEDDE